MVAAMKNAHARRDIAMLAAAAPARRPIVYRYRTGVFMSRMKNHVLASVKASGQLVKWLAPSELGSHIAVPSLLGPKPLAAVDLGEKGMVSRLIAETLSERSMTIAAIFIHETNKACATEAFTSILENCEVVTETPFDRLHIRDILKFLQKSSDMTVNLNLAERLDVLDHFATLVGSSDSWTIVNAFDMMLASVEDAKTEIDFDAYGSPTEWQRPALTPVMVGNPPLAAEDFIFDVAKSLRVGAPREQVVRELCNTVNTQLKRSAEQLANPTATRRAASASALRPVGFTLHVLAWLQTLSMNGKWRDPILGPDEFLWSLYRLASVDVDLGSAPRQGVPEMQAGIERSESFRFLAHHAERIGSSLQSYLKELRRVASSGWVVDVSDSLFPVRAPTSNSGTSFADEGPTQRLRDLGRPGEKLSRLPAYEFSKPTVILHGASEVELGNLARAYAKSILCETGAMNSWCGACPSCLRFEKNSLLGRIEPTDLGQSNAKAKVEGLVDDLKKPSLADRTVVTLVRAESAGPIILDTLLKTVEEPPQRVSFIILSRDLGALTPAIRSRAYAMSATAKSVPAASSAT